MEKAKINEIMVKGESLELLLEYISNGESKKLSSSSDVCSVGYYLAEVVNNVKGTLEFEHRIIKVPVDRKYTESARIGTIQKLVRDLFPKEANIMINVEKLVMDMWDQRIICEYTISMSESDK